MSEKINKQLKEYIEQEVLPRYQSEVKCHCMDHINNVIKKSFDIVQDNNLEVNLDMVYAIASYHDIGRSIDSDKHHIIGAEILMEDKALDKYFDKEQKLIMKEAIEDHRASLDGAPRNVYGKIVSTADRSYDLDEFLGTVYRWRLKVSPEYTLQQNIDDGYNHLVDKYGEHGYARNKVYYEDAEFEKFLERVNKLIKNRDEFEKVYCEINGIKS